MAEYGSHAVVLGAGVAGLLAARVLSDSYATVTVLERDELPVDAGQRTGVPQGRHLHNFLARGTQILGELFPGILNELAAAGATVDDGDDLSRIYVRVAGYEFAPAGRLADPVPLAAYQASRPFLEFHIRRRVAALENVTILDQHDVVEPVVAGDSVVGVRTVSRRTGGVSVMQAGLVVDATGRAMRTSHYLKSRGFESPPEERIPSVGGYSSQLLRIPKGVINERMAFVNGGSRAPGALLVAYEDDAWMLAVYRPVGDDGPPTNFDEMMAAVEQMLPRRSSTGCAVRHPRGRRRSPAAPPRCGGGTTKCLNCLRVWLSSVTHCAISIPCMGKACRWPPSKRWRCRTASKRASSTFPDASMRRPPNRSCPCGR